MRVVTINNTKFQNYKSFLYYPIKEYLEKYFIDHYPNVINWYFSKVIPEIKHNKRKIFVLIDDNYNIKGIAIIKTSGKICSFHVSESGYGHNLMRLCLNKFVTQDVIITISEKRLIEIADFLYRFGFKIIDIKNDLYIHGVKEFIVKKVN
jgi:hypothetical protein